MVGKAVAKLLAVPVIATIGGTLYGLVGTVRQGPVQRGIDAHTVRVNATYTKFISAESKYGEGTYILSYGYGGWLYQSRLPSLPGHHKVGDQLCAEIDATQPEHVRIRGTQGAYYGAITRFVGLAGLVAFLVLLIIVAARAPAWRRKRTAS